MSLPAVTTTSLDPREVRQLTADALGPPPYFIKDFVKSAKEIWPRGCVIEQPGSIDQFATTIRELRDYQPGDAFRRIAWNATARRGRFTVLETEDESQATRVVVLDARNRVSERIEYGPVRGE